MQKGIIGCPISEEIIDREGLGQVVADALCSNHFGHVGMIRHESETRAVVVNDEDVSYRWHKRFFLIVDRLIANQALNDIAEYGA